MNPPPYTQHSEDGAAALGSDTQRGTEQEACKYGKNTVVQEPKIRLLDILKKKTTEPMTLLLLFIGVLYSALGIVTGDGLTAIATVAMVFVLLVLVNVWNEYRTNRAISALHRLVPQTSTILRSEQLREPIAMKHLPRTLVWMAVFLAILIPLLGYIRGLPGLQDYPAGAVLYGLALAFAFVPRELPLIIATALGIGSLALSCKGAIVKRMNAAENLGNVSIIATDIAGILTEDKLRVEHLYFDGTIHASREFGENEKSALRTGFLASDTPDNQLSNSMAKAILERLKQVGIDKTAVTSNWILKDELRLDNKQKLVTYIYQYGNSTVALTSGEPEKLLATSNRILLEGQETPLTDELRAEASRAAARMAHAGERLLAFGYRRLHPDESVDEAEREIVFVGIIGFIDPPRLGVPSAIRNCQKAGIRILLITGEHPQTAKTLAGQIGIPNTHVLSAEEMATMPDEVLKEALKITPVFANIAPGDKLRIIQLLRATGETVAVTGTDIDDVPALKKAHIGIAMGTNGADVREAADIVLVDDNLAAIENAISECRRFNGNIRKGIRFYLASKAASALTFMVPVLLGVPLPFAPIQVLVLVLFVDLVASVLFVGEPQERGAMNKPQAPYATFMDERMLRSLLIGALSLTLAVTATYLFTYYSTAEITHARTVAFATLLFSQVFLALNLRTGNTPLFKHGILTNRIMLLWGLLAVFLLAVGTSLSATQAALQITSLGASDWVLVVGVSFLATFWIELKKVLSGKV
jgi:Ca2+-transporting ATPase